MAIPNWALTGAVTSSNAGATLVGGGSLTWGDNARDTGGFTLSATPAILAAKADTTTSQDTFGFIGHATAYTGFGSPEFLVNMDHGVIYIAHFGSYSNIGNALSTDLLELCLSTSVCLLKQNGSTIYTFPQTPLGGVYDVVCGFYSAGKLNNLDLSGVTPPGPSYPVGVALFGLTA